MLEPGWSLLPIREKEEDSYAQYPRAEAGGNIFPGVKLRFKRREIGIGWKILSVLTAYLLVSHMTVKLYCIQ